MKENNQLKALCEDIANELTNQEEFAKALKLEERTDEGASAWIDGSLDIEWRLYNDKTLKNASVLVAWGGPNILVDFGDNLVKGYWAGDEVTVPFIDNLGVMDYLEELYQ